MIKRRRRFKETVLFKDRLMSFASELREAASMLPSGQEERPAQEGKTLRHRSSCRRSAFALPIREKNGMINT